MFHSTTSTDKRSFFAILLRMVLDLDCGTCTILSGTGLRIDDLKLDAGSAVASGKKIQPDDFICITDGFDNINNMKLFIERFMGTLSERQANTIFQYIRGRRRFVITYMERAFDESNKTDDMDVLVEAWRDKAANEIVDDLAQKIAQISKRNFWADMEETIIDCHFFSGRSIVDSVDTAFAVEVGFARLDKIKQSSQGIIVVAGISEPLAIMAYLRYAQTYKTVAQKILKMIGKNQWDPSHLGKLFERYLLEPLSKLFDGKKGELCNHPLFSPCIGNGSSHLVELFSNRIEIERRLTGLWNADCPNLCATGDLIAYLNNPKLPFILPEKFAGPDIAFVINVYIDGDYDNPVRIPVFVQAKLRPYVDFNEAIRTVSPRTFFDNTQYNSFAEKRKTVIKCIADKFGRAAELGVGSIGMLIAYPCEFRGHSSRYDAANKELILVVDAANAGEFFESKTIDVLRTVKVKASLEKQRTLDDWTNYVHK
ncbi:hypothetical protein BC938DRAFT_474890 [Jimgerdemannia flammicorona]|uniref:Uncharacterized protein n=1 Tax=Jimgerdemannia flammicorona TaxID=994334 RepID=A0A433Q1P7_9FUNG|nr:hypothetical protein BC938DRAFT_474890 [Jimgerdemannia flammicorona]